MCTSPPVLFCHRCSSRATSRQAILQISLSPAMCSSGQQDRANPYPPSFIPRLYIGTVQGQPWSIDIEHRNEELALRCIELLDEELHENMCGMTLPYLRRKHALPEAISYACRFWIKHICLVSDVTDDIVNRTYNFLAKHLLHWMGALAILNSYDHMIRSVDNLIKWLRVCLAIGLMGSFH